MINPTFKGRVLRSGPLVKHVHLVCGEEEYAYVTYDVRTHANDAYIAGAFLELPNESIRLVNAHDVYRFVHEAYRCNDLRIAVVRLHKDPSVELHHIHLPKDLIRIIDVNAGESFDVRFDHVNNVSVRQTKGKIVIEVHVIKSAFIGRYEKVWLTYDPDERVVRYSEEEDELLLIE